MTDIEIDLLRGIEKVNDVGETRFDFVHSIDWRLKLEANPRINC